MKSTIIMLTFLGAFIITWMTLAGAAYLLTDIPTYKECMTHGGVLMLMLIFGWIPAVIVSMDVDENLNHY
jgi:hypothetical protein